MSENASPSLGAVSSRTFERRSRDTRRALFSIAGGILSLVVAGILLTIELRLSLAERSIWYGVLLAAVATSGVLSLLVGFSVARSPARVTLDASGVTLTGLLSNRRLAWRQIAELRREKMQELGRKLTIDVLVLLDGQGKKLAELPGVFDGFGQTW